jgi:two-component system response regulator RegX3
VFKGDVMERSPAGVAGETHDRHMCAEASHREPAPVTEPKTAILVVEDEEPIRRGLCDVLAYHGFAPTSAADGDLGLREALAGSFALIVLDVMLPGRSGLDVCADLRKRGHEVPVLMLTARGSENDVLAGFRAGADDYVTKPFSVAELIARVQAILRRSGALRDASDAPFAFSGWHIDPANLRAERGELRVDLTARELSILRLFLREQGRIVSRRALLAEVWRAPHPDRIETRTVDMQIAKLRRKLDAAGDSLLETVRGAGYRFTG